MSGAAVADQFWAPNVGDKYEYIGTDHSGNTWTSWIDITEQVTLNSLEYFHLFSTNYENDGVVADNGLFRSTEDALYTYNPGGDYLEFQKASVGTKWVLYRPDEYDWEVHEIVAVGSITVPYGTFSESYTRRAYECADPSTPWTSPEGNPSLEQSPSWYDTFVPGVGMVKEVDYWNDDPPMTEELVAVTPEPATLSLLALGGLALLRRRRK
jgi:hypothetical protein